MNPSRSRFAWPLAAALVTIFIVTIYIFPHWSLFTGGDYLEYADFAKDALRVRDAKHFSEIYGNFSRYWFSHPGPAFFYLSAAGEYIFHDWTHLVSSAPYAHILTCTIFQAACAVAAIFYLARRVGWTFIPIALAILIVHWRFMPGAPTGTWPPHVLFGPFLLLIVFGSGVAGGDSRALPVLIFAGCMLVHDYVGLPVQVVPIGAAAIGLWYYRQRKSGLAAARPQIICSLVIAAIFALPIAIDVLKGKNSNIAKILKHLHESSGDRHSLVQSIGYFLSYFRYESGQESRQGEASFSLASYVAGHAVSWIPMLISLGCALVILSSNMTLRIKMYVAMVFGSVVLAIAWGMLIDGGMYDYIGNYFYAIVFMIYLFPALLAASYVGDKAPALQAGLGLAASAAVLLASPLAAKPIVTMTARADQFNRGFLQLVDGAPVVHIEIDGRRWVSGFAVALAADRLGMRWTVNDAYRFLTGERQPVRDRPGGVTVEVTPTKCPGGVRMPTDMTYEVAYLCKRAETPMPAPPAWAAGYVGKPLSAAFADAPATCAGSADQVVKRYRGAAPGVQIVGWAWDTKAKAPIDHILIVDAGGVVVGAGQGGLARPDVNAAKPEITSRTVGWAADTRSIGGPVDAYGIVGRGEAVCRLGRLAY
jgi:hypothetical protein